MYQLESASSSTYDDDYGGVTWAFPMAVFLKVIETSSFFLEKRVMTMHQPCNEFLHKNKASLCITLVDCLFVGYLVIPALMRIAGVACKKEHTQPSKLSN